ncbi:TonB-dependent receptor [Tenacibaculum sp. IB213877]|uniref:SusC/RagA family TonB-linked outer membrane protein n=1 Tax=Tenacibaculum sp. IB213877 TaxID=3097351 RepID=UPI002A5A46E3|nr:TonB-dependent receptor [Tenacibaculum sp. IB213877]MDY0779485.1 TonB-dependent receptor [Tenacibaculum sp. IB213877]
MKNLKLLFCGFLILNSLSLFAQQTIKGTVTEKATGEPLPGVSVIIKGTTSGTETDFDGNYELKNVKSTNTLIYSFIGLQTQEIVVGSKTTISVALEEGEQVLDEVVVVGYGSVKKEDATGSVTSISSKDFNTTPAVGAEQLLQGKVPGLKITTAGGQPDAAPNIRIRGGSSLNANNNPLIVIDGVPVDNTNPAGVSNPLSLVNPNDIENFSILKDASATAIYGSRASNGVIIITTKKGTSGTPKFNFSSSVAIGKVSQKLDIMNGPEFTRFITEYHPSFAGNLGIDDPNSTLEDDPTTPEIEGRILYNTDWQDAIFRTSVSTNNNFSMRASLFDEVPFRFSVGHTKSEGLVKTNDYERLSYSLKLTPKFINDRLKVDINAKGIYAEKNAVDEGGVLGGVINMDPTKPIYDLTNPKFGGYYQTESIDPNTPAKLDGQYNPLALLEQRTRPEEVYKFLGNVEFDYTTSFLPELSAVLNLGVEYSDAKIEEVFTENALATYQVINNGTVGVFNPGVNYAENQEIINTTMDAYLKYTKTFEGFLAKIDAQTGYSYQNFQNDGTKDLYRYNVGVDGETGLREAFIENDLNPTNRYFNELNLQSFFGRANLDFANKYLLTLSLRVDGSSLFRPEKRWGYFPAAALAWKVTDEKFMENINFINNLKLRLGWGKTGQQDITGAVGFYPSLPLLISGTNTSQYLSGVNVYSAVAYNEDLTWEKATTYNIGLDYTIFNNIISGSFDVFKRETKDLLARTPIPPGQGLGSSFVKNVGETSSEGFELNVNINPIKNENFSFDINTNLAYNKTTIDNLKDVTVIPSSDGGLPVGTGVNLAYNAVGYQPHSAWVFKQLYDVDGNPIWGAHADLNEDNVIDNDDRVYKALRPNWTYGFGLNFNYKNWDLSSNFRGQIGGLVYNSRKLTSGWRDRSIPINSSSLGNVLDFYNGAADINFINTNGNVRFSDYYLEDATFLRCENITLGYRFDELIKNSTLRFYTSVSNLFLITDYTGQDPENFNGIDTNFYPRPRTYTLGINFDF